LLLRLQKVKSLAAFSSWSGDHKELIHKWVVVIISWFILWRFISNNLFYIRALVCHFHSAAILQIWMKYILEHPFKKQELLSIFWKALGQV
jgi:hypothetical protein